MGAYVPIQQSREPGWFETLGQAYQNRAQQQLMQARAQEMQQRDLDLRQQQQDFHDNQEIRRALRPQMNADGKPQPSEAAGQIANLRGLGTTAARKQADAMEQAEFERQQQQYLLQQHHQKIHDHDIEEVSSLAASAMHAPKGMEQTAWTAFVKKAREKGFDLENHLSDLYSPEAAQYYGNLGASALEQIRQQREQDQASETTRHHKWLEQNQANQLSEMQRYHNGMLATRRGSSRAPASQTPSTPQPGINLGDYLPDRRWQ
jgi:hypothetical protein